MKTACFTGRRPKDLAGFRSAPYKKFSQDLRDYLRTLCVGEGIKIFITGGAQGFDQLAFWAVDSLKSEFSDIQNFVYVPFEGQESHWSTSPIDSFNQEAYKRMLKAADYVKYVSEFKGSQINKVTASTLMQQRNVSMVNDSDLVIALYAYDDWNITGKGGTCNTMRLAYKNHKAIYQIKYTITSELNFGEVVKILPKSKNNSKLFQNLI